MRLPTTTALTTLVAVVATVTAAPVPAASPEDNLVEAHEEGLLLLVPTLPADNVSADKNGKDLKREVEYELISIPKEVLRREIRQVAQLYGTPKSDEHDSGNIIISPQSYSSTTYGTTASPILDLSKLLLSGANQASGIVQTLSTVGQGAKQVLAEVVPAAASGGAQAVRWLAQNKADGVRTAVEVAGQGLRYAGQLSSAVLRVLLQVPGIKARVLSEVIRASQPLSYAISDVLAENSDELGEILEAKNDILRDTLEIFIRLIQDTLALKGKILARLGASGLDVGATAFNAGVRIGGAFLESAGGIATALGSGVGDLIRVGASANFPPPPTLPTINLPALIFPSFDLTKLFARPTTYGTTLAPLPLPSKPAVTPAPITTKPSYSFDQPSSPSYSYDTPSSTPSYSYNEPSPSQTYLQPGR